MSLFFGTSLRLNINGFLSDPVSQLRGLRQGDPISPILFNLAFEPWLRKILLDTSFKGFSLPLSTLAHPQDENLQAVKLLAYADDVLCLLHDPGDLRVLQSHLSLYSRASNAKVNFHKTQVLSLSGSPLIYPSVWRDPLLNHNISHWHDCRSLEPLIYLGFPLCSSSAQRNFFLDNLLHKIRISCNLHSQRSLSIRGRVTILNTLVLSKLWHVLRLTSAPLSFFDKVKSLMSSFLTFRMFPKISLSSMCRPRSLGGLGVLDPLIQQGALQLRWIIPLLSDCVTGPLSTFWVSPVLNRASIILPRLTNFLLHHLSSFPVLNPLSNLGLPFDHRLSFLFPDLRPNALRRLDGVFALLFRSMDLLPKEFTSVVLSATTCLSLPVSAIVSPPADDALILRTLNSLLCETSYICNSQTNRLRPKRHPEFDHHPNLGKKLLKLARYDDIRLTPFFIRSFIPAAYAHLGPRPFVPVEHQTIDASPFLLSLQLATVEEQPCLSSKQYRRQCLRSTQSGSESSNETLPSHKWLQFWSFPILHACRNVWYRLLHQKIPHKFLLHRLLPTHFTSAQCPVCLTAEDTLLHFVFQCPAKLAVWRYVWRKYFPLCPFSPEHVQKTVISLKFPLVPLRSTLAPASVIIGHTLLAIWRAHWQLVFDNRPFDSLLVSHSATRLIQTSVQEQLVKRYMVHAPIPHIVL
ncbi:hypothetical protein G6F51_012544 [Rhizopus arrhizus]|uniref:Reverse transcriptase domain-containing protein n=1 Tax=Rhizopus oryzae TaxID=64495 RepID=A0A9P7C339_RHIOR|nr:hypothetical protein G6F51_012544 [Rhizopus arrhizus]